MNLIDFIYCLVLILMFLVVGSLFWYEKKTKAPAIPTLPWVRSKMMKILLRHADPKKSYNIAELGSGWGALAIKTAKCLPKSTLTGYEIALAPYWVSKIRGALSFKKIKFKRTDFFKEDLSQYNIIVCYLLPWHMEQLKPQLEKLKPGSLVIANAYGVPGWTPIEMQHTKIVMKIPIFIYKI